MFGKSLRSHGFVLSASVAAALAPLSAQAQDAPPQKVRTSSEANSASLTGAMTAPFRDINLIRTDLPAVLLKAQENPYDTSPSATCREIADLIAPLDAALGEDLPGGPTQAERTMSSMALGAVADAATDVIPFRSWVRRLSGAERHDRRVSQAIHAGYVRRAYLKGFAAARGCNGAAVRVAVAQAASTPSAADVQTASADAVEISASPETQLIAARALTLSPTQISTR